MQLNDEEEEHSMPAYRGWFKIWRQVFEHPIVGIKSGRTAQWLDLIAMASFEPTTLGELSASRRFLAARWGWSQKAVRCFLQALESEKMLVKLGARPGAQDGAKLSICNYSDYQATGPTKGPTKGPKEKKTKKTRINTSLKREVVIASDDTPALTAFSVSMAFKSWNALAERLDLPVARTLTTARQRAIGARLREHGGADAWHKALANVEASAFLQGKGGGRDGWRASLDFLVQASSFSKVIDGVYGNGATVQDTNSLDHYRRILGTDGEGGH